MGVGTGIVDNGTWTIGDGGLQIGREAQGTLTIQNSGLVTVNSASISIASTGGSTGVVNVDATSQLIVNGFLDIGNGGFQPDFGQDAPGIGTLNINGGSVTAQGMALGENTGGTGTVTVDGGTLDVTDNLTVAQFGTGVLQVTNDGVHPPSDPLENSQ